MHKKIGIIFLVLSVLLLASLSNSSVVEGVWERPMVVFPLDNPVSEASVELGSALFFESLLSKDSSLSCQSCHLNNSAFADHLPLGEGIKGRHVTRNTPTLFNVAYHPYYMMDGKFKTLEDQVLGPINEHREFDMNPEEVISRLKTVSYYNELSKKGYGKELDMEVVQKSIANFERVLIADNSKFDQFKRGVTEFTEQEQKGWELFNSPSLNCYQCHSGFNFTNYAFENNGLAKVYSDSGRALMTKKEDDLAKFKVPTLRNIEMTSPYMHDGSLSSLEEVIAHYASGGLRHKNQSTLIKGFKINKKEQAALLAFLSTLTELPLKQE